MTEPVVAATAPCPVEVTAGQTYFWCACGRSKTQPFCDSSHKGTGINPVKYVATRNQIVFFCACKQSTKKPVCDGSHAGIGR